VPPGVDKALPEACKSGEGAGDEDGTPTAEELVERLGEPAADKGATKVGSAVDQAGQPGRAGVAIVDAELGSVEDLGAVNDGFI
jgi:hypothetical protein